MKMIACRIINPWGKEKMTRALTGNAAAGREGATSGRYARHCCGGGHGYLQGALGFRGVRHDGIAKIWQQTGDTGLQGSST